MAHGYSDRSPVHLLIFLAMIVVIQGDYISSVFYIFYRMEQCFERFFFITAVLNDGDK